MPEPEQRQQRRISCRLPIQIHAPSADALIFSYTVDLSQTGAFVRASRPLPVGTAVRLEIEPGPGDRLQLDGTVMWIAAAGPRGMGVRFEAPEGLDRLNRLVRRESRSTAGPTGEIPLRLDGASIRRPVILDNTGMNPKLPQAKALSLGRSSPAPKVDRSAEA